MHAYGQQGSFESNRIQLGNAAANAAAFAIVPQAAAVQPRLLHLQPALAGVFATLGRPFPPRTGSSQPRHHNHSRPQLVGLAWSSTWACPDPAAAGRHAESMGAHVAMRSASTLKRTSTLTIANVFLGGTAQALERHRHGNSASALESAAVHAYDRVGLRTFASYTHEEMAECLSKCDSHREARIKQFAATHFDADVEGWSDPVEGAKDFWGPIRVDVRRIAVGASGFEQALALEFDVHAKNKVSFKHVNGYGNALFILDSFADLVNELRSSGGSVMETFLAYGDLDLPRACEFGESPPDRDGDDHESALAEGRAEFEVAFRAQGFKEGRLVIIKFEKKSKEHALCFRLLIGRGSLSQHELGCFLSLYDVVHGHGFKKLRQWIQRLREMKKDPTRRWMITRYYAWHDLDTILERIKGAPLSEDGKELSKQRALLAGQLMHRFAFGNKLRTTIQKYERKTAGAASARKVDADVAGEDVKTAMELEFEWSSSAEDAARELEEMGLMVSRPPSRSAKTGIKGDNLEWSDLAGYEDVKRELQDTFVVPFRYASIFDKISQRTRKRPVPTIPRGVLFEGPPGTGKTMCARILAAQCKAPLVNFRIEMVVEKWYGESERTMGRIFDLCRKLGPAVLLFIDEVDSVTPSRDSGTGSYGSQTTRRLLSILLRNLDGFESASPVTAKKSSQSISSSSRRRRSKHDDDEDEDKESKTSSSKGKIILLGATNRVEDLDAAIMSRFDLVVQFGLPDSTARAAIFSCFAKQLPAADLEALAEATEGFSGRDIHDVCAAGERTFVSRFVEEYAKDPDSRKGDIDDEDLELPELEDYLGAVERRRFRGGQSK